MTPPPELRGAVLGRGYRLGHAVEGEDAVFEATHERVPGKVIVRVFANDTLSRPDAGARIHQAVRLASLLRATHAIQLLTSTWPATRRRSSSPNASTAARWRR